MQALMGAELGRKPLLCPHPYQRKSCTVFVSADDQTMGVCGLCLDTMKRLIRRRASLDECRLELGDLGYDAEDAERFHADMQEIDPADVQLPEDALA